MIFRVEFTESAKKSLKKLDVYTQKIIITWIVKTFKEPIILEFLESHFQQIEQVSGDTVLAIIELSPKSKMTDSLSWF